MTLETFLTYCVGIGGSALAVFGLCLFACVFTKPRRVSDKILSAGVLVGAIVFVLAALVALLGVGAAMLAVSPDSVSSFLGAPNLWGAVFLFDTLCYNI